MSTAQTTKTKADVVAEFRRGQILEAARAAFSRQGVTETTVDDIARSAGVAKGTVYLYYRSKDDVLQQLLAEDLDQLRDRTLPIIRGDGSIEQRLTAFIEATLMFFEQKRDFVEHCQLEMSPDVRKKVRVVMGDFYSSQAKAWDEALRAAADRGDVDRDQISGAPWSIVSFAKGLALQRLAGYISEPVAVTAAFASQLLWKGLATR